MSTLKISEVTLISPQEKKARKFSFHSSSTTLFGRNNAGKSSIIKSIIEAFGAKPIGMAQDWKDLRIISIVKCQIGEQNYTFLKRGKDHAIFDQFGNLVVNTRHVLATFAPAFAKITSFKLQLLSRSGIAEIPPPAYALTSFYIDQDGGWSSRWGSLADMSQYPEWKDSVSKYFSGIWSSRYFMLKSDLDMLSNRRASHLGSLRSFQATLKSSSNRESSLPKNFDPKIFQGAVDTLVRELQVLDQFRSRSVTKISALRTEADAISDLSSLAMRVMRELAKDYDYVSNSEAQAISCPFCGTNHENSFRKRFGIAADAEHCAVIYNDMQEEASSLEDKIQSELKKLQHTDFRIVKIRRVLEEKRGKIKFQDFIEDQAHQKLLDKLNEQIALEKKNIARIDAQIAEIKSTLSMIENPSRQSEIQKYYIDSLRENLEDLRVTKIDFRKLSGMSAEIQGSGNMRPRVRLATFFAMIKTFNEFSDAPSFPLIIDAPLQQEPDEEAKSLILDFIYKNVPRGQQLILSLAKQAGVRPSGHILNFDEERSILEESEFTGLVNDSRRYLDAML